MTDANKTTAITDNVATQVETVTVKTVTVEALQAHTYNGKSYEIGDTYEIDEQYVESVTVQGKAVRADRVAHAKEQRESAQEQREAASHPVAPMGTQDFPITSTPTPLK